MRKPECVRTELVLNVCDVVIALTWYLRIQDALRFQEPFLTALATRLDACCMSPWKVA